VVRHELAHLVTLQRTNFNVPHWFTEGLAVWAEGFPRPQKWNALLARRLAANKLFDLGIINAGFTRPNSSEDWQLAYCQAELYVEYMLDGRKWSETTRAATSRHPQPAAGLACAYLRRGANREAFQMAERALKLRPRHQRATYVMARLHIQAGRPEHAVELLAACLDRRAPDPLALNLLAGLKLKAKLYEEAADSYRLGANANAANLTWLRSLARVYLLQKNAAPLADVLRLIAQADADDVASVKKLAELAMARRDFVEAALWANRTLEIDVNHADAHCILAEAGAASHNYEKAIEEFEIAIELSPKEPRFYLGLASAY
jgi:tetratricopeptide (TPR) repeat protein